MLKAKIENIRDQMMILKDLTTNFCIQNEVWKINFYLHKQQFLTVNS